jgi:hypothetical protein
MSHRIFAANGWESMKIAGFLAQLIVGETCCSTGTDSKYLARMQCGFANPLPEGSISRSLQQVAPSLHRSSQR